MRLAVLQARMTSSRFPGKMMQPLAGEPLLARLIERIGFARRIDRLVIATSKELSDDPIAQLCQARGTDCYRGNLDDVLDRVYQAALLAGARTVIRLTGDCPLLDPAVVDATIELFETGSFDYTSNVHPPTFPDGLDVEVMRFEVLETAWREAKASREREHVTPYVYREGTQFRIGNYRQSQDLSALRWTVDNADDYQLVNKIYTEL